MWPYMQCRAERLFLEISLKESVLLCRCLYKLLTSRKTETRTAATVLLSSLIIYELLPFKMRIFQLLIFLRTEKFLSSLMTVAKCEYYS